MVPVHLLMSVFITDKSLQGIVKPVANSLPNSRLDEFLSTVHSMSTLSFISCDFYLEFDKVYENYSLLVLRWLKKLYPSARFYNYRLSSFLEWQVAEKNIPKNTRLVMLQTNFDHPYIAEKPESFSEFCSQIDALNDRAIGNITHWPEAISSIINPWRAFKNNYERRSVFTDECEGALGTCLVTKQLFSEWWENDFTQGAKIVRPDNPFGPSVRFLKAKSLVPKTELFRHMEGYGHVFIKSPWAQGFRPCCSIKHGSIVHTDWIRGNPELKTKIYTEPIDLPKVPYNSYTANETTVTNLILVASSHRINFRLLKNLKKHYTLSNANLSEYIFLNLLKNRYFFNKIPGYITNQIVGGLMNCVLFIIGSDKKIGVILNYLSIIYSYGWVRGTILYTWIKFKKLFKLCAPFKLKEVIKKIVLG